MDNGRTLGIIGDNFLKYADVISGREPITMIVCLSGGFNARIHPPMLVFKDKDRSYLKRGVNDNIPGVCYRSSPKEWMDSVTCTKWISERALPPPTGSGIRHLFVDNCSSHVEYDSINARVASMQTVLHILSSNATYMVQPADSFFIQKIKDSWRKIWNSYKYDAVQDGKWKDSADNSTSGMLENPGKTFFLHLAADAVRQVNSQRDSRGLNYARKDMIRTELSLNVDGIWSECQLSEPRQIIIAKYRSHFEGELLDREDIETESESEGEGGQ